MAVHIGSPKQGQWGQQGQTPNFSHTHARYNWVGKSSFPCLPTGLCPAGTSEKKRTTGRITESTALIRLKRFTK